MIEIPWDQDRPSCHVSLPGSSYQKSNMGHAVGMPQVHWAQRGERQLATAQWVQTPWFHPENGTKCAIHVLTMRKLDCQFILPGTMFCDLLVSKSVTMSVPTYEKNTHAFQVWGLLSNASNCVSTNLSVLLSVCLPVYISSIIKSNLSGRANATLLR